MYADTINGDDKMRKISTLIAIITALSSSASLATDFICWDGSYGYNAAGFFEKEQRYELTINGLALEDLSFKFLSRTVTTSNPFRQSKIHIPFKMDECHVSAVTHEWNCETTKNGVRHNLFVEHHVNDLANEVHLISGTQSTHISAKFKPGISISVTFVDLVNGERRVQNVDFNLSRCDGLEWGDLDKTHFPAKLQSYLNADQD
jgi:hypothetical protein